jgi:ABC-type nitrate/sulfonate/bicarbonate transport system substrate-binding protein
MRRFALLGALLALALAGCAGGEDRPNTTATVLLDAPPNGVHAGIYSAVERGYDRAEGVELRVRAPSSPGDPVRRLTDRRVDFAILDIHALAIARERGEDVVGVMSIAQRPLATLFGESGVTRPRQLEGRRVAVSGRPSDDAILRAIVTADGGDPSRVRRIPVGFDKAGALRSGRVAGAVGFWDVEGVALRETGVREFRLDDDGAPSYPELVLTTTSETLQDEPSTVRATVAALQRGYAFTLADPESSASDLLARVRRVSRDEVMGQLDVLSSVLTGPTGRPGELDLPILRRWAAWEARVGIVRRAPDVGTAFVTRYADVPAP